MIYLSDGKKFSLSYRELKTHYDYFCRLSDEEFLMNISDALHLACIICWLKEIPSESCLSDTGIIHELIHLLSGQEGTETELHHIRELFRTSLSLQ